MCGKKKNQGKQWQAHKTVMGLLGNATAALTWK